MDETIHRGAPAPSPAGEESAGELVREALDETRALVRLEVALAREEIKDELTKAKVGAAAIGGAAAAGVMGGTLCLVAMAAAFSAMWLAALILGVIVLVCGAAAALLGWRALPKRLMNETRDRLELHVKQLKERIV
ncbi:MAG TPA: phage holin family protein [Polyangiaceae bacterium]|nr:phage holin family protein [Polyangiaceae bacterium]